MASDNQERFRDLAARISDLAPYVVFLAFVGALRGTLSARWPLALAGGAVALVCAAALAFA